MEGGLSGDNQDENESPGSQGTSGAPRIPSRFWSGRAAGATRVDGPVFPGRLKRADPWRKAPTGSQACRSASRAADFESRPSPPQFKRRTWPLHGSYRNPRRSTPVHLPYGKTEVGSVGADRHVFPHPPPQCESPLHSEGHQEVFHFGRLQGLPTKTGGSRRLAPYVVLIPEAVANGPIGFDRGHVDKHVQTCVRCTDLRQVRCKRGAFVGQDPIEQVPREHEIVRRFGRIGQVREIASAACVFIDDAGEPHPAGTFAVDP